MSTVSTKILTTTSVQGNKLIMFLFYPHLEESEGHIKM